MKTTRTNITRVVAVHNALSVAGGQMGKTVYFTNQASVLCVCSPGVAHGAFGGHFRLVVGERLIGGRQAQEAVLAWNSSHRGGGEGSI